MQDSHVVRIGVIGTGFVSRHFTMELAHRKEYALSRVLTRRPVDSCGDFPFRDALTNSLNELIDNSDIIFECTGDVLHATETVEAALASGKPVLTLNPEFHVTTGSYFVDKGFLTEADGDQPGCQASLFEEAAAMGFEPIVLGGMGHLVDLVVGPARGFALSPEDPESMRLLESIMAIDESRTLTEHLTARHGVGLFALDAQVQTPEQVGQPWPAASRRS